MFERGGTSEMDYPEEGPFWKKDIIGKDYFGQGA